MKVKRYDSRLGQWIDCDMSTKEIATMIMAEAFANTIKEMRAEREKKEA